MANLTTGKACLKRKQKNLAFHGAKSLKFWMEGGKRLGVLALPSPLILTVISKLFTTTKALHAHSAAPCKQGKEPERYCTKTGQANTAKKNLHGCKSQFPTSAPMHKAWRSFKANSDIFQNWLEWCWNVTNTKITLWDYIPLTAI